MLVSDFDFDLPEELVAQRPMEPRDACRLLVYDRRHSSMAHTVFRELPKQLESGDLLVLNDTQVMPHKLLGKRVTGGKVEILILERDGNRCRGYVKPARKIHPGEVVSLEDGRLELRAQGGSGQDSGGILDFDLWVVSGEDLGQLLSELGRAPLPPYIRRDGSEDPSEDRQAYQTIFARVPGAVAAPTAGMHFTEDLLQALEERGVGIGPVTLHVGEGTFAPVRVQQVEQHQMHAEHFELGAELAEQVKQTKARGSRVVAVGTTAARTLESCATENGLVEPGTGWTEIFLYPGKKLRVVDALLTNFHLPGSTLLMLVAAMTGREEILGVYREAMREGYRFYSYGDAMLIL